MTAAALALILMFSGSVTWVLTTHRIPETSDQAIVGLMALDILHGKGHPIFYYGSTYAGSLEAHYLAVVFRVFGGSMTTYRGAMVFLVFLIVLGVWELTRRTFGARAAFFGTAYLALPPAFFLYKGTTSDGHYASAQLIALGLLSAALWQKSRASRVKASVLPLSVFGLLAGIGLWVTPISPPVVAAALLWLLLCGYLKPFGASALALGCGAIVGSGPWWYWNAGHRWMSLSSPDVGLAGGAGLLSNLGLVLRKSLAVLLGASQPFSDRLMAYPGAWPIVGLLLLVALAPLAARPFRRDPRILLFVLAGLFVLVAGAASRRFAPTEPRFLVTLYAILPPLIGCALGRATAHDRFSAISRVAFVGILATHAAGLSGARTHTTVVADGEVTGSLNQLVSKLKAERIDRIYASYWTAYRVSFETLESIIATPLRGEDIVRQEVYEREVDGAVNPALVLLSPRSNCFEDYLVEHRKRYRMTSAGAFSIFSDLEPGTLALLRNVRSIPLPSVGHAAWWKTIRHPHTVAGGETVQVSFEVTNASPCSWMAPVHVGHRWTRTDIAGAPVESPVRFFLPGRIEPGQSFRAEFPIRAPVEPGTYVVTYDLVQEMVAWFGNETGTPNVMSVSVRPGNRS
ncbi:MAG: hypothetical protein ABIT01_16350 [Thermoanaerobaculia bacterium]